jgi:hypothetical protein
MNLTTTLTATGLAAGLALTGVTSAQAARTDVTLPPGGVLEKRVTSFCHRLPDLLDRVDRAQTRINGDAGTKGSLAWLKARKTKAAAADHPKVAARIDRRIERRTERLAKLPKLKVKLTKAQGECTALDLPAPSQS